MLNKVLQRLVLFRLGKPCLAKVYPPAVADALTVYSACGVHSAYSMHSVHSVQQVRTLSDEVRRSATVSGDSSEPSVFERIIARDIPADIIYEDDVCVAFNDASPQAPVHFLVVPRRRLPRLQDATDDDLQLVGHLVLVSRRLGSRHAPGGWRLVVNNGPHGAQSVYHLHLHVLGGRQLGWPPG